MTGMILEAQASVFGCHSVSAELIACKNPQASVFGCQISAELIACKNQAFGCAGTSKVPNEPREHRMLLQVLFLVA